MKAYKELTHRGKMRRMRRVAQAALQAYGLADAPLKLFVDNGNIVYRVKRVRVPQLAADKDVNDLFFDDHCALRIHQPGYQTAEAIASEVAWLAALRREAGLAVPEPVPTLQGELMATIAVPGVDGVRNCTLLRWVKGRSLAKRFGPQHLRAQGRLMAQLHDHAARWRPPRGFTRLAYDWDGLFGEGTGTGLAGSTIWELVPARYYAAFDMVSQRLRQIMDAWGSGPDVYGMIHGDLDIYANVFFWKGQARAIDFDDSRFGYWLFDLAVALEPLQEDAAFAQYRDALLEGYAEIRPLPQEQVQQLPLFQAASNALYVMWSVAVMHLFGESRFWTDRLNRAGHLLQRYVKSD